MTALVGYTAQTRPLRRIIRQAHQAHKDTAAMAACSGCGGELTELARARVFAKREDGQRYRCVACGSRYISFMGNLLKL